MGFKLYYDKDDKVIINENDDELSGDIGTTTRTIQNTSDSYVDLLMRNDLSYDHFTQILGSA